MSAGAHAQAIDQLPLSKQVLIADPDLTFDPYSVMVRFAPDATDAQRAAAIAAVGGAELDRYTLVPGLVHIEITGLVKDAITTLNSMQGVEYAEPDFVVRTNALVPNDPLFSLLWGMQNTGQTVNADPGIAGADARATDAWSIRTGDANFVIAIIDSGTLRTHQDLAANIWTNPGEIAGNGVDDDANGYIDDVQGYDFFSRDNDPSDPGHGTHTAGTVGAVGNNGVGVAGVAWNCKLMALRFIGPTGGFTSDAVLAIQYAAAKQCKVSNNSWGGGAFSQSLFDAIGATRSVGHVFVASAGNSGINNDTAQLPAYPASFSLDNIISVAATDNNDARASFSNYGPVSVDLGAPGVNIASCYGSDTGYGYLSGTSMAGPHVAGVAALVYMQNPSFTYLQVKNQILSTARPVAGLAGLCVTGGVLNAVAALGGTAPPTNSAPVVTITAPTTTSFASGAAITFAATAVDAEDGNRATTLVWTSNLQGQIGTGATFTTTALQAGSHTITARATDTASLAGTATRTLTITAATPPTIPSSLRLVRSGSNVTASWRDRSNNETGFQLRREQLIAGNWTNQTIVGNVGANVVSFVNAGLGAGNYRYSVRAVNGGAASAWTGWVGITIP